MKVGSREGPGQLAQFTEAWILGAVFWSPGEALEDPAQPEGGGKEMKDRITHRQTGE